LIEAILASVEVEVVEEEEEEEDEEEEEGGGRRRETGWKVNPLSLLKKSFPREVRRSTFDRLSPNHRRLATSPSNVSRDDDRVEEHDCVCG
jgi:hypothetical protein